MKILKKILFAIIGIFLIALIGGYVFMKGTAPVYSGELKLPGLKEEVTVRYDHYGIPHIKAKNEEDAYYALGYVHAQDRLFQMEIIRRLTSGRLAELLGEPLVKTDKMFRTLGIRDSAEKSAKKYFSSRDKQYQKSGFAYLDGVNAFIRYGNLPVEYSLLNIPRENFTPADMYSTLGFMSLGFTMALSEEPVLTEIRDKLGDIYLEDWKIGEPRTIDSVMNARPDTVEIEGALSFSVEKTLQEIGIPIWSGSNAWVVSPERSKSGKVIVANDTHIGFSQPSVFYEVHLEYPGFNFYGEYLAGMPFGIVGHTKDIAWGLTIFPIDNMDLFKEKPNPDNPDELWAIDHWQPIKKRKEIIKVKDHEDVVFDVELSRHGPIINDINEKASKYSSDPVALWWIFDEMETQIMEALYIINNAKNMETVERGAALIDIIGQNFIYGDSQGNIAWWGTGKVPQRREGVNSKFILDGSTDANDVTGYYDFSDNPKLINPKSGFIASANNDPGIVNVKAHPGYYLSENRILRIIKLLSAQEKWSVEDMKAIQRDDISDLKVEIVSIIHDELKNSSVITKTPLHEKVFEVLSKWNGNHGVDAIGATIYTKFAYNFLEHTVKDEVGEKWFDELASMYITKLSIPYIVKNKSSVWWDDVSTKDVKEDRKTILAGVFDETVEELRKQLGGDINQWQWGKVHTLEHVHPIGRKEPFDKVFNVGPFPASGGGGVINKLSSDLTDSGKYKVKSGPAIRILLDFADVENSLNINPTGQSGNIMSNHYKDQAEMFIEGKYRKQMMNEVEIEANTENILVLKPK